MDVTSLQTPPPRAHDRRRNAQQERGSQEQGNTARSHPSTGVQRGAQGSPSITSPELGLGAASGPLRSGRRPHSTEQLPRSR
ncbi:hypothetical protein NHX12_007609 [Muraenolepis orangiensis]|uniref:Uncharacterized protein n=1 Tax=Muraenolepis orangiensis TaxID=630683 RepID=A0A9Q0I9U5_9TELE|nr:hypothetical protein NHX12_007609 [Muraenolepis orangiensis]